MNRKYLLIIVSILLIITSIVSIILFCGGIDNLVNYGIVTKDDIDDFKTSHRKYLDALSVDYDYDIYDENHQELGYILAKKNEDWSKLPLTRSFREKYNEKDGVLGDLEYDEIKYRAYAEYDEVVDDFVDFDTYFWFRFNDNYFEIVQGKKKTVYIYYFDYDVDDDSKLRKYVNDIMFETIPITDEEGNRIKVKEYEFDFNLMGPDWCFIYLCRGGEDAGRVAVSDKFKLKYPEFIDIFYHNSPMIYHRIELVNEMSDYDNNKAYFKVYSKLEWKERHYVVNYTIDANGYLDDAIARCVGEYDQNEYIERGYDEYQAWDLLFFKNSHFDEQSKITERLKTEVRNSEYKSIFQDIDMISSNFMYQEELYDSIDIEIGDNLYQIIKYVWKDGSVHYYDKYIKIVNKKFDEVVFKHLPYTNMNVESMKNSFNNDKIYLNYEKEVKHMIRKLK